ncbi:unnamed protein product, partial [Ectocarpus sp. 8 AP-2014]
QRKPERSEHLHPDPSLLPGRLGSRTRQQRSGERSPKGRGQGRGRRPQQGPPVRVRRAGRVAAGPSGGRVPRRVPELRGGGRPEAGADSGHGLQRGEGEAGTGEAQGSAGCGGVALGWGRRRGRHRRRRRRPGA